VFSFLSQSNNKDVNKDVVPIDPLAQVAPIAPLAPTPTAAPAAPTYTSTIITSEVKNK
jgi:hypothetical protein